MIGLGSTLRCNQPPGHIWVVLNDPQATGGKIVMVNLTTLNESCVDDICVLGPADYDLLQHPSTVAYSRCKTGNGSGLERAVGQGLFTELKQVPPLTLLKILDGARHSPEIPLAAKNLVPRSTPSPIL